MAGADLTLLSRELNADTLVELQQALRRGTTILLSHVGDGDRALIADYKPEVLQIDAVLSPGRNQMRAQLLRDAVARLVGGPPKVVLADMGPRGNAARLAVADAYGSNANRVVSVIENHASPGGQVNLSITDVLAGVPDQVPLVVFEAHLLETDARWDLRETGRPLLLITRPDHLSVLTNHDAPFYGQANTVRLEAPAAREWSRALQKAGQPMHPSDLDWLLDRTRGRVNTTISALQLMVPNRSPRSAWRLAVRESRARAHDTLLLAREVHEYAPTLLLAIAQNQKPYSAVPDAKPARVALALRKLQGIDIIEQPEPRSWQIADPLLQHALISLLNSMRAQEIASDLLDQEP